MVMLVLLDPMACVEKVVVVPFSLLLEDDFVDMVIKRK
jgi:hypothetical protein